MTDYEKRAHDVAVAYQVVVAMQGEDAPSEVDFFTQYENSYIDFKKMFGPDNP